MPLSHSVSQLGGKPFINPGYLNVNHGDHIFFSILNHHKCLAALFEYLCYGYKAIINIFTLTVLGSTLDIRIWRLQTSK